MMEDTAGLDGTMSIGRASTTTSEGTSRMIKIGRKLLICLLRSICNCES